MPSKLDKARAVFSQEWEKVLRNPATEDSGIMAYHPATLHPGKVQRAVVSGLALEVVQRLGELGCLKKDSSRRAEFERILLACKIEESLLKTLKTFMKRAEDA